jgi:Carboxypeptidase regulatory-like domain
MPKPFLGIVWMLVLSAGLGFASTASAKGPIGNLVGTVLDSKGRPVADATVTMQSSDGKEPYATHTDATGHFKFERYETGQYDLRAYSHGAFSEWVKRVSIRSKKTAEVTLHMPPPPDESVTVSK